MITKILLTLIVAIAGYLYLKRRSVSKKTEIKSVNSVSEIKPELPVRLLAIIFLVVALVGSGSFFAFRWFDGRTLLEVTLVAPDQPTQIFQVYKKDLQERSFLSTDGQMVRIAAQERLQVRKITD